LRRRDRKNSKARRGLAAPVSLLLIVFSLTLVSTVTYNYALRQIDARKEDLKLVAAEEKMLDLEEAITSTAWTPSGSRTLAFSNYGGQLRVETAANPLQINVTLGASNGTVYNSDTGRFIYELPSTILGHEGRWIRGDRRAIVNLRSIARPPLRKSGKILTVGWIFWSPVSEPGGRSPGSLR